MLEFRKHQRSEPSTRDIFLPCFFLRVNYAGLFLAFSSSAHHKMQLLCLHEKVWKWPLCVTYIFLTAVTLLLKPCINSINGCFLNISLPKHALLISTLCLQEIVGVQTESSLLFVLEELEYRFSIVKENVDA